MLIKPKFIPADPTKVCRTCACYDPILHVCCANDYAIRDEEANTLSCSDWNPKKICITCGYFDPDTNQCWFEEHDMSEEESLTRTCESWEPRKNHDGPLQVIGKSCDNCGKCHPIIAMCTEHPDRSIWPPKENVCDEWVEMPAKLQPDGSLKMKASETIGCHIINGDGITVTSITTGLVKRCSNCANYMPAIGICRQKDMIISNPDSWACGDKWEPKTEEQPVFGGTSLKELEVKQKNLEKMLHIESDKQEIPKETVKTLSEFMSDDGSIVRARMLESLDIVFGLAIQQAPTLRERWIRLREQCIGALQMRWKQEDEKKEKPS